jgi:peroxisomal enoyl-CoA hydratase 2
VIETETTLIDRDSLEAYSRYIQSAFYVKQGNWGGPTGPSTPTYPPPKGREGAPDKVLTTKTTKETSLLYRLNGDYNPLHASPEIGQKMGFGGTILHGLYSFNRATYGLIKEFGGGDSVNIREIQARFAAPVRPGETTITKMWRMGLTEDGWEEIRFAAYVEGGKAVLTNGKAIVKCVAARNGAGKL